MDPYYELFSTPPEHMAPLNERDKNKADPKQTPTRSYKPRNAKALSKLSQPVEDLVFSPPVQTYTPKKVDLDGRFSLRQRAQRKGEGAFTSTPTRARARGAQMVAAAAAAASSAKKHTNHNSKKQQLNSNKRGSLSFDAGKPTTRKAGTSKQQANNSMKQSNLWDKCMKTNPDLQNYIDQFNQSLEAALKTPLDIRLINED